MRLPFFILNKKDKMIKHLHLVRFHYIDGLHEYTERFLGAPDIGAVEKGVVDWLQDFCGSKGVSWSADDQLQQNESADGTRLLTVSTHKVESLDSLGALWH